MLKGQVQWFCGEGKGYVVETWGRVLWHQLYCSVMTWMGQFCGEGSGSESASGKGSGFELEGSSKSVSVLKDQPHCSFSLFFDCWSISFTFCHHLE